MSDDPLTRARQALARYEATTPATAASPPLDKARLDTLILRARAGAPEPARARVLVDMTCSENGRPFFGVAERDGNKLLLVGAMRAGGNGGGGEKPELLSGSYSALEAARNWVCPECRTPASGCMIWTCGCAERNGAVHCGSKGNRASFCACGRYERHRLVEVASVTVRGESVAAASRQSAPGRASPGAAPGSLRLPGFNKER